MVSSLQLQAKSSMSGLTCTKTLKKMKLWLLSLLLDLLKVQLVRLLKHLMVVLKACSLSITKQEMERWRDMNSCSSTWMQAGVVAKIVCVKTWSNTVLDLISRNSVKLLKKPPSKRNKCQDLPYPKTKSTLMSLLTFLTEMILPLLMLGNLSESWLPTKSFKQAFLDSSKTNLRI